MATENAICKMDAVALSTCISAKSQTPVEVVEAVLTCMDKLEQTVTQRVKQDIPLNFFWRLIPRPAKSTKERRDSNSGSLGDLGVSN